MKFYRYYRFSRYLYTLSSFISFLFLLLNSPQYLVLLLKFARLSHVTIFSQSPFKDLYDVIKDTIIISNPRGYNSTITRYTKKIR